jgi:hypothetical protein
LTSINYFLSPEGERKYNIRGFGGLTPRRVWVEPTVLNLWFKDTKDGLTAGVSGAANLFGGETEWITEASKARKRYRSLVWA